MAKNQKDLKKAQAQPPDQKDQKKTQTQPPSQKDQKKAQAQPPEQKDQKKAQTQPPEQKDSKKAQTQPPDQKDQKKTQAQSPEKKDPKKAQTQQPEKKDPKKAQAQQPEKKDQKKAQTQLPDQKDQKKTQAQSPEKKDQKKAQTQSPEQKDQKKAQTQPPEKKDQKKAQTQQSDQKKDIKTRENDSNKIKLDGLFAFKMSMSAFYDEGGNRVPVTALKYEPCKISQIKSRKKESYEAVQVAFKAQKNKRCSKALITHLKPSGFKEGARFVREIRQQAPENLKLGQEVSIESLKKGDLVKITSLSKGRGFSGVMKRWNFAGGKASHGSKSHRRTGSIGQHTEPARVFPGRKMPGQYGFKKVSRLKAPVVDVFPEEGIIFVKGPVPGARNTLVSLRKMTISPLKN